MTMGNLMMDELLLVLNWVLPLVYLALAFDYGATFILRSRIHVRNPWLMPAILLHLAFLVLWGIHFGAPPLMNNHEVLSVVVLASVIVYWVVELISRDRRAGVFVFLLIFLLQYTSSAFLVGLITTQSASEAIPRGGWGRLHVLPASLAYTALVFAAVYAMLYLVGRRNLKLHRFGLLFDRLPPLELLGRMSWYALLGGFALMTVTMLTGAIFFSQMNRPEELQFKVIAKIVIGSIAWVVCAVAVLGKYLGKWPVLTVSRVAVAGCLLILALFITSVLLS